MSRPRVFKSIVLGALIVVGIVLGGAAMLSAQAVPPAPSQDEQVLMRGPVHEAFAETVAYDPQPGVVVPKAPPAPIEELPPDQRPEGANVTWIPGYWAWDDDRNDFLWVSGIWRDLPVGRQWVPGYWSQTESGYQWTSGYWADAQTAENEYLPEPPQSVEAGPNVASPSPDSTWLPGIWLWRQGRFAWRPGYWATMQPNWIWVPDHYVWTPGGYVFVGGYWDYSLSRRGILFAPVYFNPVVYARPRFVYSPSIVIGLNAFVGNLFLRPRYCHYYFGDYYALNYERDGFYPWFSYRGGYDPFFAHQRWEHRNDRDWDRRLVREFQERREHVDLRPPRTFAQQQALFAGGRRTNPGLVMGTQFNQFVARKEGTFHFQPVSRVEAERFATQGRTLHATRLERQKVEFQGRPAGPVRRPSVPQFPPARPEKPLTKPMEREVIRREPQPPAVNRGRLPHSPIVARPANQLDRAHIAPQIHNAPKLDLRVEPKPRPRVPPPKVNPQPRNVRQPPKRPEERKK